MPVRMAQVATADLSIRYLLRTQLAALTDAGYEVTAVCAPGPSVGLLRQEGLRVETVPMVRELRPRADLRSLVALIRLFRRHAFDVVVTHTPKAGLVAPVAAQLAGVPLVLHTVHGLLFHDRMPLLQRLAGLAAETFTARWADHLLFQSAEDVRVAQALRLKRRAHLGYIGNGVDTARFHPATPDVREEVRRALGVPGDAFVVGTVGRLVREKGYGELFAAAQDLLHRHPGMHLVVIGPSEPDQSDGLREADLARWRGHPNVRLLGHREDVDRLYAAMDLFVLPSHREGIPRSLMEASASGLPVVASDIRGCREVVIPGVTGTLVPVRDARQLARAIESLARDRHRCSAMGLAGRDRLVAHFDERLVIERLLAILATLLGSRAMRGAPLVAAEPGHPS
ncbi:MAG TPA: glycosyltransferase family 4 protein [Nitriliruptorales bacterium]|nr:glycosyltransferase family 4 protein [Nitriliruptorales bacterium]